MTEKSLLFPDLPHLLGRWGPVVLGNGPSDASVVIVGEAPGVEEEKVRRGFVGPAGQLLDDLLQHAGLDREAFYITNVLKKRPLDAAGDTRSPLQEEIEAYQPSLWDELGVIKPSYVLALGAVPVMALFPDLHSLISKLRGSLLDHPLGFQVFVSFHPAYILRRQDLRSVIEADFMRFAEIISGKPKETRVTDHQVILTVEGVRQLRDTLLKAREFSFDLETRALDWQTDPILCAAFSPAPGEAYVVPLVGQFLRELWQPEEKQQVLGLLKEIFASDVPKGGQNWKFDVKFLEREGIVVRNLSFDTLIEHHLLDENLPHGLKFLVGHELGEPRYDEELLSFLPKKATTFDVVPEKVLWKYAAHDTDFTQTLHEKHLAELAPTPKGLDFYGTVAVPLQRVLTDMEFRGVEVDQPWAQEVRAEHLAKINQLDLNLKGVMGEDTNLNSTKQLRKFFFVERGLASSKKTAGGNPSVDDEVLKQLAEKDPIAKLVQDRRELVKVLGTFIDGVLERLGPDGRIHTSYSLTGTVTWRLSSRDPNVQNIPDDPHIRGMFCAPPGYVFVGADYDQIELLVMAALAQEESMLTLYAQRKDLHSLIAAKLFGIPAEDVTKPLRTVVKTVDFGLNYGRGPGSLAKQLEISYDEAIEIINLYFAAFPKLKPWRQRQMELARQQGYIESPFGFRRHLNYKGASEQVQAELDRQALNSPIQGSAATITNIATIKADRLIQRKALKSILAMTLHDALFFYVPEATWQKEVELIREVMEDPIPQLGGIVPHVSIEVGYRWGDDSLLSKKKI